MPAAGVRINECCLDVDGDTDVTESDDAVCGIVLGLSAGWSEAGEANIRRSSRVHCGVGAWSTSSK